MYNFAEVQSSNFFLNKFCFVDIIQFWQALHIHD